MRLQPLLLPGITLSLQRQVFNPNHRTAARKGLVELGLHRPDGGVITSRDYQQ